MTNLRRRLNWLERQHTGRCRVCRDWPDPCSVLVSDDGDGDAPVCPICGWQARDVIVKAYVGVDLDAV